MADESFNNGEKDKNTLLNFIVCKKIFIFFKKQFCQSIGLSGYDEQSTKKMLPGFLILLSSMWTQCFPHILIWNRIFCKKAKSNKMSHGKWHFDDILQSPQQKQVAATTCNQWQLLYVVMSSLQTFNNIKSVLCTVH